MGFVDTVKDGAIQSHSLYKILPSLTIAQAILESGWGKYAPHNNMFGIKWTSGCGYDFVTLPTKEYFNGKEVIIEDNFRSYPSLDESIKDHAKFLVDNPRYSNLIGVSDYKEVCRLIQVDGYATDPNYANSLIEIIEENELYKYDKMVVKELKYIVCVNNQVDARAGNYLAEFLNCPIIDMSASPNFSLEGVELVLNVGGGYFDTQSNMKLLKGETRWETMHEVLKYIGV